MRLGVGLERLELQEKTWGVEPYQIPMQLSNLCADGNYWLEHQVFSLDHCAIRFHHRLVSIHPFPNGNGRHGRLVADLLMLYSGKPIFSWGGQSLDVQGATRKKYLKALREADAGKYESLISFALDKE